MNQEQYESIKSGVLAWNAWREKHQAESVDLRGADLRGADLSWAILHGADLSWAILHGARNIWEIGPIGSRNDILHANRHNDGLHYFTGCFGGTEAEFLAAVEKTHGDSRYGREYRAAVALMRVLAEEAQP